MNDDELAALEAVQFNWAVTPEDVWSPVEHHVEGLHERAARALWRAVPKRAGSRTSPVGIVLQGEKGVGKTHLLRWLRQQVQNDDGYFFLLKPMEGDDFWRNAVHGILDGFRAGPVDQLSMLLQRLSVLCGLSALELLRVTGTIPVTRPDLDALIGGLRKLDDQVWADCQDTLRALVLSRADRPDVNEVGNGYLSFDGDVEEAARSEWGFRGGVRTRQLVVRDLSRLLALTGPTVLAVDQIDPLISQATEALHEGGGAPTAGVSGVADGLMELRETTRRALTVVACLPASWAWLSRNAVRSAPDRFRVETLQGAMPSGTVAGEIVARHLGELYGDVGFTPSYPTWPVLPEAFRSVEAYTPRLLLQRVEAHIRDCLDVDEVHELADLREPPRPRCAEATADDDRLRDLDGWFAQLQDAADVEAPLDQDGEDERIPALLFAGLRAWVAERGDAGQAYTVDLIRGRRPPVHARLRRTLDESTEREVHYAFRAIAHPNARAAQSRLSAARTEAGLGTGGHHRRLLLLRNRDWPSGKVTAATVAEIEERGAVSVPIGQADLRALSALEVMQRSPRPGWLEWLAARQPASAVEVFRRFLPDVTAGPDRDPASGHEGSGSEEPVGVGDPAAVIEVPGSGEQDDASGDAEPAPGVPSVLIGRTAADQTFVNLPVESLRKHVAVFAGSGSGKTVLLRRLVEECACQGVSAIVLDINNDLVRLGDAWPSPPEHWLPGDADRAADYLRHTEVVVWTPGRNRGRPLSFQPLPDFTPVLDDEDELRIAVDTAVASLSPRAGLSGRRMTTQGEAVLRESLTHFARNGGSSLAGYIQMLAELPEGWSSLRTGSKLAAAMAEALRATMINDPLLSSSGEPADPSILLRPSDGYRARVSVISFVGLPDVEQQTGFVNQLQMALFSWIKANPAGDVPLGGLFVMDEAQNFAPSRGHTACTASSIALASQARKYGLGLVFATQNPRGLHNWITGNAATQFFGFLNGAAPVATAKELAGAKGGRVDDISRLEVGQFYAATTGQPFELMRAARCLSHHPPSPPSEEEVIERAARGR